MALMIRRTQAQSGYPAFGLAIAHNKACAAAALVGALFHADLTSTTVQNVYAPTTTPVTVTAANAADLPTCIALANGILTACVLHLPDGISTNTVSAGAHKVPDATNLATIAAACNSSPLTAPNGGVWVSTGNGAADLAAVIARANAFKTALNAHFAQAGVHFNNDGTNTIAASAAVDLASSITLLNAIKTSLVAHLASAPTNPMINLVA